jgi:hypothetical protein
MMQVIGRVGLLALVGDVFSSVIFFLFIFDVVIIWSDSTHE